jgi:hypothetical protein
VEWLKWYRACLTSVRPWVQTPVQKKKKNGGRIPWAPTPGHLLPPPNINEKETRAWHLHSNAMWLLYFPFCIIILVYF